MSGYLVIKSFIDSKSRKGYNEGSTFTTEDSERASFLVQKGYLASREAPINEALLAEAKFLKVKGYTKMNNDELEQAISAMKLKKEADSDGE